MIIADTGPLVALLNADDKHHVPCLSFFTRYRGSIVVPAPVVTEVAYLAATRAGPEVEAVFLDSLGRGELLIESLISEDYYRMAELVREYADFPLGTVDASVVAIAERLGTTQVATVDLRHFRAVRPRHCSAFEIYPSDA